MPPGLGPACIPITVGGVPILAFLSSTSPCTYMSTAFADRIGIEYSDISLSGETFTCFGKPLGTVGLARPVTILLGWGGSSDIKITLNTVVVFESKRELSLGVDFFAQSARCQIDVLIGDIEETTTSEFVGRLENNFL
jgi:hypothetical protein